MEEFEMIFDVKRKTSIFAWIRNVDFQQDEAQIFHKLRQKNERKKKKL